MSLFYIVLISIFVLGAICLGWRLMSTRQSIPCPSWLSFCVEADNPFAKTHRASAIVENADIRPCMAVLDAGCGPGRVTLPISRKVGPNGKVLAMDLQEKMLEKVRVKVERAGMRNIDFLNAGLGQNKLGKNQFDRITLVCVLGEIPDQKAALHELYEALKPKGILSITETICDPHFQTRTSVVKMSHSVGFCEKERFGNLFSYTMNLEKPHQLGS